MSKTSEILAAQLEKAIDKYLDAAKNAGVDVTRDDVISVVTKRLEELIKGYNLDDEIAWVASGMAVGIATVLTIELKITGQKSHSIN